MPIDDNRDMKKPWSWEIDFFVFHTPSYRTALECGMKDYRAFLAEYALKERKERVLVVGVEPMQRHYSILDNLRASERATLRRARRFQREVIRENKLRYLWLIKEHNDRGNRARRQITMVFPAQHHESAMKTECRKYWPR